MDSYQFHQLVLKLDKITALCNTILKRENVMSQELDALTAQVGANNDLVGSAITLIGGLRQQIIDAKLKALTDSLAAKDTDLAAALVANTPAAAKKRP